MEEQSDEVKLYGMWASGFCTRVKLALKLKGIPYAYVEEDLSDKSMLLIERSFLDKTLPVLVHNGIPVTGSRAILEYIDEHWNHPPKLFPDDPLEREKVRSWAKYFDNELKPSIYEVLTSEAKEYIKSIEKFLDRVETFEKGIQKDFPDIGAPFTNGKTMGFLDIVVGSTACNYRALNEAIDAAFNYHANYPLVCSWVANMSHSPLMKETLPPHDQLVAKLRAMFSLKSYPKVED